MRLGQHSWPVGNKMVPDCTVIVGNYYWPFIMPFIMTMTAISFGLREEEAMHRLYRLTAPTCTPEG